MLFWERIGLWLAKRQVKMLRTKLEVWEQKHQDLKEYCAESLAHEKNTIMHQAHEIRELKEENLRLLRQKEISG